MYSSSAYFYANKYENILHTIIVLTPIPIHGLPCVTCFIGI